MSRQEQGVRTFLQYTVQPSDLPVTVEGVLKRKLHLTARQISRGKFTEGGICRNGERVRVTEALRAGDTVTFSWREAAPDSEEEERHQDLFLPLILYEDEDLLIVNKPAGMPVHPGRGHYGDSLLDAAQQSCSGRYGAFAPGLHVVGRLDKDTSGAAVLAKSALAAARLSEQPRGQHYKTYGALVRGVPPLQKEIWQDVCIPMRKKNGTLNEMEAYRFDSDEWMSAKNQADPAKRRAEGWMEAHTRMRLVAAAPDGGFSLIEAVPVTGRTHQIRVHMAALGHPLLYDPIYGSGDGDRLYESADTAGRCMLHCARVHFLQPFTDEPLTISAPYPADFRNSAGLLCPYLPGAEL